MNSFYKKKAEFISRDFISEKFGASARYTRESAKIFIDDDMIIEELVMSLQAEMLGSDMSEQTHTFEQSWPADWWEHFKLEFFPSKLLKRLPVKYTGCKKTVKFTERVYFPDADIEFIAGRQVVKVHKHVLDTPTRPVA